MSPRLRHRFWLIPSLVLHMSHAQDRSCTLECHNRGVCTLGRPSFGFSVYLQDVDIHPYANKEEDQDKQQHCECPKGWTGLLCEIEFVTCGNDDHVCFNGAPCRLDETDRGEPFYHCECSAAHSDLSRAYAGHFCQHVATVMCSTDAQVRHSFCTNGGRCRQMVGPGEEHQDCNCGDQWEGPHCEYVRNSTLARYYRERQSKKDKSMLSSVSSNKTALVGFVLFTIVGVVLVVGLVVLAVRRLRATGQPKYPQYSTDDDEVGTQRRNLVRQYTLDDLDREVT